MDGVPPLPVLKCAAKPHGNTFSGRVDAEYAYVHVVVCVGVDVFVCVCVSLCISLCVSDWGKKNVQLLQFGKMYAICLNILRRGFRGFVNTRL